MTTGDLVATQQMDAALCRRIALSLWRKHLKNLLRSYPEYTQDDIVAEGYVIVLRQWGEYDGIHAQSTFIQQRMYSGLIDYCRRIKAGKNKIKRVLERTQEDDLATEAEDEPDEKPLAEWLVEMQEMAKKTFRGPKYRSGRRFYKIHQLIAIASMMEKHKMTCRRAEKMLTDREDLRNALGLRRVPTYPHLFVASHLFRAWQKQVQQAA